MNPETQSNTNVMTFNLMFSMAAAAGLAVANIYYNQPMISLMERELPERLTTLVPTATQLGYAIGLFLLVPLGDRFERRRLICIQFFALALSSIGVALAPNAALLVVFSFFLGATATVAQQIIPFAAHLSAPERRGSTVGNVMAGLLCGILLSRTLAGFVGTHAGWREMFWLSAPLSLFMCGWMAWRLPKSQPSDELSYLGLLRSLGSLWIEFRSLRVAIFTQASLFAAFTVFWTILAFHLQEPQFGFGADVAGLFGVVGAVGILAAPIAGRISDRKGPRILILLGAILTLVAWTVFGVYSSLAGLIIGVILLDFGVQSALIANQSIIFALRPEARGRLNTLFMCGMFIGGAAGSASAIKAWSMAGWWGATILGGAFAVIAIAIQLALAPARISR